jgi:hypothetical protein
VSIVFLTWFTLPKQKINNVIIRYAIFIGIKDIKQLEIFLLKHDPRIPKDKNYIIDKYSFTKDYNFWTYTSVTGTFHENLKTPFGPGIKVLRTSGNNAGFSLYYNGPKILYYANHTYEISFKIKFIEGDFNSFNIGWYVDDGGKGIANTLALKKEIKTLDDGWFSCISRYTFIDNHNGLIGFINSVAEQTTFIVTDFELKDLDNITQYPRYDFEYQDDKDLNAVLDKTNAEIMFSDRTTRWQFAKDNWNMKFRWYHKLFGHGFDYMEWYGEKFMGDSKKFDWPHNPFISTILYSGIIGLVFYLLLLLKVFMLYIEYRKKYAVLLIGFLITFFFSFFSGSSPFDPPIMGFFIMLPFLIQSIHKKDNCKNNA